MQWILRLQNHAWELDRDFWNAEEMGLGRSLRVGVVDCLESQKKAGFLDDLDGLDAMRRARLTTSTRWRHPRRHPENGDTFAPCSNWRIDSVAIFVVAAK